jgi:hypothetical protein
MVLALSVMLGATPALAHPERIPLQGTDHRFFGSVVSVRQDGNVLYFTGQQLAGTFNFGALAGTESQLVDANLNIVTGSGRMGGTVSYVDAATGLTCAGTIEGKITNFLANGKVKARCSDGAKMRLDLADVSVTPGVDGVTNYTGTLSYGGSDSDSD